MSGIRQFRGQVDMVSALGLLHLLDQAGICHGLFYRENAVEMRLSVLVDLFLTEIGRLIDQQVIDEQMCSGKPAEQFDYLIGNIQFAMFDIDEHPMLLLCHRHVDRC